MLDSLNLGNINFLAVLVAAIAAFALGGIWYSKFLFGKVWIRESQMKEPTNCGAGHCTMVYGVSFLLLLLASAVFALSLGPQPPFAFATIVGFIIGLCWVTTAFGINYLFAGRSLKLFLIDAGYNILQFTLFGVILGLWH